LISILTSLATFIAALLAFLKAIDASSKVQQVSGQVQELHLSINGRMQELLDMTKNASHAEGVNEGISTGTVAAELKAAVVLADQKTNLLISAIPAATTPMPVTAPDPLPVTISNTGQGSE
jgi:uncharacterized radical SAM superfamily protein